MKNNLIIIGRNEDEVFIQEIDQEKFLKDFNDGYWGDPERFTFIKTLPTNLENFLCRTIAIIKGNTVIPKTKIVVKKWTIEE